MQLTGNGSLPQPGLGAGRAIAVSNSSQWAGDYLAAGVTSIVLDVNNLGTTDLTLRLAIVSHAVDGGTFALTTGISVPAHGTAPNTWSTIEFSLDPSAWTPTAYIQGTLPGIDINAALADVTSLRILHSENPSWQGESVVGQLAIDNITAVPEPGTLALVVAGLALLAWSRPSR
jgi:hypothetical protein